MSLPLRGYDPTATRAGVRFAFGCVGAAVRCVDVGRRAAWVERLVERSRRLRLSATPAPRRVTRTRVDATRRVDACRTTVRILVSPRVAVRPPPGHHWGSKISFETSEYPSSRRETLNSASHLSHLPRVQRAVGGVPESGSYGAHSAHIEASPPRARAPLRVSVSELTHRLTWASVPSARRGRDSAEGLPCDRPP